MHDLVRGGPRPRVFFAGVVKLVDAEDSKSSGPCARVGSTPTSGTTIVYLPRDHYRSKQSGWPYGPAWMPENAAKWSARAEKGIIHERFMANHFVSLLFLP